MVWRPYGTPLVTSISRNEIITRRDIQSTVQKMLSPMLLCEKPLSNSEAKISEEEQSLNLDVSTKLPLHMIDENNVYVDLTIGDEKTVRVPSSLSSMRVFIDWSMEDLQKYDTSYLENLPEVQKYGPAPKKTRSEPLSLYACLEAFLREEPLVPEDMW